MKLYIGNLSYDTPEDEIREALSEFGSIVELRRPHDRDTGKPRGFAFVTFASREAGEKALAELDDSSLGGRKLKVNEAEERRHPADPKPRASMDVDVKRKVDDRPIGPDGKRIRYKSI